MHWFACGLGELRAENRTIVMSKAPAAHRYGPQHARTHARETLTASGIGSDGGSERRPAGRNLALEYVWTTTSLSLCFYFCRCAGGAECLEDEAHANLNFDEAIVHPITSLVPVAPRKHNHQASCQ